jgi:hypothetical protein
VQNLPPKAPLNPSRPAFAFTIRLSEDEHQYFQVLSRTQGHRSVASALKAHALSQARDNPLAEMRHGLEHMQERISENGAWLQDRLLGLSTNLDRLQSEVDQLLTDMQTCTEAVLLIAQTNEALTTAVTSLRCSEA